MISVKEAVREASTRLRGVIDEIGEPPPEELRFEEVELSDDDKYWFVTLSYLDSERMKDVNLFNLAPPIKPRVFKQVKLDAGTGAFRGIKDRGL